MAIVEILCLQNPPVFGIPPRICPRPVRDVRELCVARCPPADLSGITVISVDWSDRSDSSPPPGRNPAAQEDAGARAVVPADVSSWPVGTQAERESLHVSITAPLSAVGRRRRWGFDFELGLKRRENDTGIRDFKASKWYQTEFTSTQNKQTLHWTGFIQRFHRERPAPRTHTQYTGADIATWWPLNTPCMEGPFPISKNILGIWGPIQH